MEFMLAFGQTILLFLTLVSAAVALFHDRRKRDKERKKETKDTIKTAVEAVKIEVFDKFESNRKKVKYEKQLENIEQKEVCQVERDRIKKVEHSIHSQKELNRLNLKCHDTILEVLEPQGNGRVKKMRAELKKEVFDKASGLED